MVQLEELVREVTAKSLEERKAMQLAAIRDLHARGLEDSGIATYLEADLRRVHDWGEGKTTAWPAVLANLLQLSRMKKLPKIRERERLKPGRVSKTDLPKVQKIMAGHGLWPPRERVKTLTSLLKATNLNKTDFARKINVGRTQVKKYFDPDYAGAMSEPVIDAIASLKREVGRNKKLSPDEEFKQYVRVLFGREYAEAGFPRDSTLKERAFKELYLRTGVSIRALERNLPPNTKKSPRRSMMRAIRLAAEKGPLLPELAGRKRGGSQNRAAAGAA